MIRRFLHKWPLCVPYDSKTRICFRSPVWNHRCRVHTVKAQALGEQL